MKLRQLLLPLAASALLVPATASAGTYAPARFPAASAAPDAAFLRIVDGWSGRIDAAFASAVRCKTNAACIHDRVNVLNTTGSTGAMNIRLALKLGESGFYGKPPTDPCARWMGQLVARELNTWRGAYWFTNDDFRSVHAASTRFKAERTRARAAAESCR